jgi:hypothetical protein
MAVDFKNTCFVIMPFGKEGTVDREDFDDTYKEIIKKAVVESKTGLKCVRADELDRSGSITGDIIDYAINSKVVVADLTSNNPNVMYELGIRHARAVGTILMARKGTDLPFDTKTERTIIYDKISQASRDSALKKLTDFLRNSVDSSILDDSPVLRRQPVTAITSTIPVDSSSNKEPGRVHRPKVSVGRDKRENLSALVNAVEFGELQSQVKSLAFHYGIKEPNIVGRPVGGILCKSSNNPTVIHESLHKHSVSLTYLHDLQQVTSEWIPYFTAFGHALTLLEWEPGLWNVVSDWKLIFPILGRVPNSSKFEEIARKVWYDSQPYDMYISGMSYKRSDLSSSFEGLRNYVKILIWDESGFHVAKSELELR